MYRIWRARCRASETHLSGTGEAHAPLCREAHPLWSFLQTRRQHGVFPLWRRCSRVFVTNVALGVRGPYSTCLPSAPHVPANMRISTRVPRGSHNPVSGFVEMRSSTCRSAVLAWIPEGGGQATPNEHFGAEIHRLSQHVRVAQSQAISEVVFNRRSRARAAGKKAGVPATARCPGSRAAWRPQTRFRPVRVARGDGFL